MASPATRFLFTNGEIQDRVLKLANRCRNLLPADYGRLASVLLTDIKRGLLFYHLQYLFSRYHRSGQDLLICWQTVRFSGIGMNDLAWVGKVDYQGNNVSAYFCLAGERESLRSPVRKR